jgi:hypothetical protein
MELQRRGSTPGMRCNHGGALDDFARISRMPKLPCTALPIDAATRVRFGTHLNRRRSNALTRSSVSFLCSNEDVSIRWVRKSSGADVPVERETHSQRVGDYASSLTHVSVGSSSDG